MEQNTRNRYTVIIVVVETRIRIAVVSRWCNVGKSSLEYRCRERWSKRRKSLYRSGNVVEGTLRHDALSGRVVSLDRWEGERYR